MSDLINRIIRIVKVKRWSWKKKDVMGNYMKPIAFIVVALGAFLGVLWICWLVIPKVDIAPQTSANTTMNASNMANQMSDIVSMLFGLMPMFLILSMIFGIVSAVLNASDRND